MNYINKAMELAPITLVLTVVIYTMAFFLLRRKRPKQPIIRYFVEAVFVSYVIFILILTLFEYRFGGSVGFSVNLRPFKTFQDASQYGSTLVLKQYVLNIIAFLPIGFLLPVVFPKAMAKWKRVFLVALLVPLAIETIQFFLGRVTDIDDVITNFSGTLTGFSFYILLEGGLCHFAFWKGICTAEQISSKKNHLIAIAMIILTWTVPAGYVIVDELSEFGYIPQTYYTLPKNVDINMDVSEERQSRMVYVEKPRSAREEDLAALQKTLFLEGSITKDLDEGYRLEEPSRGVIMNADGTWRYYQNIENKGKQESNVDAHIPDDEQCQLLAKSILDKIGMDLVSSLKFDKIENIFCIEQAEGRQEYEYLIGKRVIYRSNSEENEAVRGEVYVELGEEGIITGIYDNRKWYEPLRSMTIISQAEAIERAKHKGTKGPTMKNMKITHIEGDYYQEWRKGHLRPVWMIEGTYLDQKGQPQQWQAMVDAMK